MAKLDFEEIEKLSKEYDELVKCWEDEYYYYQALMDSLHGDAGDRD